MKLKLILASLALLAGSAAFAQSPADPTSPKDPLATPRVDRRQVNQERRIDQGIASGALTNKEAGRLDRRETKIQADKLAARSDGKVTRAERRKLAREQNRASAAIRRQKHDRQTVAR
jgi:hypothetical protein